MESSILDKDLAALQEVRTLVARAKVAAEEFAHFDPKKAWHIAEAVCRICEERTEFYARWALEETGIGRLEDKISKNRTASRGLLEFYRNTPLGGAQVDNAKRMILIARSAGVIMGLIASTSPIATLYFKILSCLMTRNAVILSPHPLAIECSVDAVERLRKAAQQAGAPADAIQIQKAPTLEATLEMMRNPAINLILATGGSPMVRAAYSSGNPALGVGPGNVPVYVDASANIPLAVSETLAAKLFDYGSPCSAPSALFVHRDVAQRFDDEMRRSGAFYCDASQQARLEAFAFPHGHLNTAVVGRSPAWIAEQAGLSGAANATALVGRFEEVTTETPMVKEKLSPILGLKYVDSREQAIRDANMMLSISGAGHTAGIFSEDIETIALWGSAIDTNRNVVNKGTSSGATGNGNHLTPTLTIGTGFAGRSSIGENVGPHHLINWKRVAFPVAGASGGSGDARKTNPEAPMEARVRGAVDAILQALGERRSA
ncbi:MAG TPA: aldehyde dehydrogenase family protein [Acidobacteriaceae bacterium]|nr:aldehyde dehydrogenase family protein [Acidobacteriaceae bacterium]